MVLDSPTQFQQTILEILGGYQANGSLHSEEDCPLGLLSQPQNQDKVEQYADCHLLNFGMPGVVSMALEKGESKREHYQLIGRKRSDASPYTFSESRLIIAKRSSKWLGTCTVACKHVSQYTSQLLGERGHSRGFLHGPVQDTHMQADISILITCVPP